MLDTQALLAQEDVKSFFIHHQAMERINEMFAHTRAVANTYGLDSPEYAAQADSLAECLGTVFGRTGFGNRMQVTCDVAPLSLYCSEDDAFVFGMIFHRDLSHDGAEVVPGTWSLHS